MKKMIRKLTVPISASIEITNNCNSNCIYCYNSLRSKSQLNLSDFIKILNILDKNDIFQIKLSGGEPTMHTQFLEFSNQLSKFKFNNSLVTNLLIDDVKIIDSINTNFNRVGISIDGPEKIHDKLRGKGSFKKIMSVLPKIKIEKIMYVTISKINCDHLKSIIKLAEKLNFAGVVFLIYKPQGHQIKNKYKLELTKSDVDLFFKNIIFIKKKSKLNISYHDNNCGAGIDLFNIKVNGDVSLCAFSNLLAGNILFDDFYEINKRMKMVREKCKGKCCIQN